MKRSTFRLARGLILGMVLSLCCVAAAFAEASPSLATNDLKVQKQSGGAVQVMDMTTVCTETDATGAKKICLCMSVCYRISQILANTAWTDGVFRSWDVEVETGWNTDGPQEFFAHAAGVASLKIADGATPDKDLTLQDAWYRVKILSTGKVYEFRGTDKLYMDDFLALRSKMKNKTLTPEEEARYVPLRKQVVSKMTTPPFQAGAFEVTATGGTTKSGSSGGCSLGGGPLAALLLFPLGLLRRRD